MQDDKKQSNITLKDNNVTREESDKFYISQEKYFNPSHIKSDYHHQRLQQSKIAFYMSNIGAISGFVIIAVTVIYSMCTGNSNWIGIVTVAIIEAVSSLFFALSNNANDKITEFFSVLTKDSNIENALALVDKVKNVSEKDKLIIRLALHLSGALEKTNNDEIEKQTSNRTSPL